MLQAPARFLVLIESGGVSEAIMFTDKRERVADFDAATEEVAVMTTGLAPAYGAGALPEWDEALSGHSPAERSAAVVYTLDV